MSKISRRELLQQAGAGLVSSRLMSSGVKHEVPEFPAESPSTEESDSWIKSIRLLLAEGYNPPFFPRFTYDAARALNVARRLDADSLRFPAMGNYVHFPTKTRLPIHPELDGRDPFLETIDAFHNAGLKVVAYIPLNHPFMPVGSGNANYQDWIRRYADGSPMTTGHYGFGELYEGCLNSPIREQILAMVREIVTNYPVDLAYFDGPYQGMDQAQHFCHCKYCQTAYKKATGKIIPMEDSPTYLQDEIAFWQWTQFDVVRNFMQEVRDSVLDARKLPLAFNNSGLIRKHDAAKRCWPLLDAYMFEHLRTPEQKLFNLQLGQSTGKPTWTYLSSYTVYNQEHLKTNSFCGWYSYPAESQELMMEGATATAVGAGLVYWGLSRLYELPDPLSCESGQLVREIFSFSKKQQPLFAKTKIVPQVGILVGSQTIDWYQGKHFVLEAYSNYYQGAYQVLKELNYDGEPFLDNQLTAESLGKYRLVYVANAPCLSDEQCSAIAKYVEGGGSLIATHLTSVADEYGRIRKDFGLAKVFGAKLKDPEPLEAPELYLRVLPSGLILPQDPQVVQFEAAEGATVLAETYDRGYRRSFGPAVVSHSYGNGKAIYVGSGLEAIYQETRMEPLRSYLASLVDPILTSWRTYEVEARSGLMPHFRASKDHLFLHLLANNGNKWKKTNVREKYVPIDQVKVRIRLPTGREVKAVKLLYVDQLTKFSVNDGWVDLVVPRVLIHETVHVALI